MLALPMNPNMLPIQLSNNTIAKQAMQRDAATELMKDMPGMP